MRGLAIWVTALALVAAGCGLKVEPTAQSGLVDGSLAETGETGAGSDAGGDVAAGAQGTGAAAGAARGAAGTGQNGVTGSNGGGGATTAAGKLFPNDIEGLTDTTIKICVHVPITGAAPVDRNPNRFGKFYFDWVNANGGIHGRKVEYKAFDDRYNPANAVQAASRCHSDGAFLIAGAAGTDQLVAVAKKARDLKFPYLMGPASVRDVADFTPYAKLVGPDYEFQHDLLADFIVQKFGKNVKYGMVRIDSDFFKSAHDQFVKRLQSHGITLAVDEVVQKDANTFTRVLQKFADNDVRVINNFTTPTIWLKMLKQKPPEYNPTFTAVSPAAGFNLIAEALTGAGDAFVFHHFAPAYPATGTDNESNIAKYPYAAEIRKFKEIFDTYATVEPKAPRDDIDWQSYISAKSLHRLLEAGGRDITRTKLWTLIDSYKETPERAYPGCPADFTRAPHRGAWFVNVLKLGTRQWDNMHLCMDRPPAG